MKKSILILVAIGLSTFLRAQTVTHDSTKTEFKNAVALDGTALIAQFANNGLYGYYYPYPEVISYRRFIKSNAIKIALGGYVSNDSGLQNDSVGSKNNRQNINIRVGLEHYSYLGKKWTCYFGADLIYGYTYTEYGYTWSPTSYRNETTNANAIGLSPLLGVVFKINSRLSVATEASFDITYSETRGEKINSPDNSMYDARSNSKRLITQFAGLQFINVRLKF